MARLLSFQHRFFIYWAIASAIFTVCHAVAVKPNPKCTHGRAEVRKEWSDMRRKERIDYTKAVNCIMSLPSKLNQSMYPGAKTRYDDFVALHINETLRIHFSGTFLPWHRQYIRVYQDTLRTECGYKGVTPYWDWTRYLDDLYNNKLFDGSASSMSGDGEYNHNNAPLIAGAINVPIGKGGGCIKSGPFKNATMNLGPVSNDVLNLHGVLPPDTFRHNPRCIVRDLHPETARINCNKTVIYNLLQSPTMEAFQTALSTNEPFGFVPLVNNPHGGGHFTFVGDTTDFFISPTDPLFFLHHAQVDRLWASWQALDPGSRQFALNGTNTMFNDPPSSTTNVDDLLSMGIEGKPTKIGDVMDVMGGDLCYKYQEPLGRDVDAEIADGK